MSMKSHLLLSTLLLTAAADFGHSSPGYRERRDPPGCGKAKRKQRKAERQARKKGRR